MAHVRQHAVLQRSVSSASLARRLSSMWVVWQVTGRRWQVPACAGVGPRPSDPPSIAWSIAAARSVASATHLWPRPLASVGGPTGVPQARWVTRIAERRDGEIGDCVERTRDRASARQRAQRETRERDLESGETLPASQGVMIDVHRDYERREWRERRVRASGALPRCWSCVGPPVVS